MSATTTFGTRDLCLRHEGRKDGLAGVPHIIVVQEWWVAMCTPRDVLPKLNPCAEVA